MSADRTDKEVKNMAMEPRPTWASCLRFAAGAWAGEVRRWAAAFPRPRFVRLMPEWLCGVCGYADVECVCSEAAGCDCLSEEADAARTAAGWHGLYGACNVEDAHMDRWKLQAARARDEERRREWAMTHPDEPWNTTHPII